jgi:hypothetical protein
MNVSQVGKGGLPPQFLILLCNSIKLEVLSSLEFAHSAAIPSCLGLRHLSAQAEETAALL